jgi:diaminopimelate epimerase
MGRPELEPAKIPLRPGAGAGAGADRFVRQEVPLEGDAPSWGPRSPWATPTSSSSTCRPRAAPRRSGPASRSTRCSRSAPTSSSRASRATAWRRVWERGVGFTEACGTGACAALVAAVLEGRLPRAGTAGAAAGGALQVLVPADLSTVWMQGPAERVFAGEWEPASPK